MKTKVNLDLNLEKGDSLLKGAVESISIVIKDDNYNKIGTLEIPSRYFLRLLHGQGEIPANMNLAMENSELWGKKRVMNKMSFFEGTHFTESYHTDEILKNIYATEKHKTMLSSGWQVMHDGSKSKQPRGKYYITYCRYE